MRVFVQREGQEPTEVPVHFQAATDHQTYYANGAQGGILGNYHFRVDFYQDMIPALKHKDFAGKAEIEDLLKEGIERRIVASVYLSLPFAKELARWLDKHLKEYENEYGEIQLPKSATFGKGQKNDADTTV